MTTCLCCGGESRKQLHDNLVRHLNVDALQIDELWSRVQCSQKRANQIGVNDEIGDQYTYPWTMLGGCSGPPLPL
jgi:hypothetical protein